MGPDDTYDVLTTKLTILKLMADGSNWPTYQEHVTNAVTSKKLQRHLISTACKLAELVKRDGSFFHNNNSLSPMSDMDIEDHEELMEEWLQKEAQVHEIIYGTVDQSTFHQVKGETTTLLSGENSHQFMNAHFVGNSEVDMHTHLANMVVIKECLAKIGCPLSDASFASYICTSLSLAPSYKPLFTTLAANAHASGQSVTSQDLIWHLNEEANSAAIKASINHQHKVMVAVHAKAQGSPKGNKGKPKGKGKGKEKHHCNNCEKDGHTKDQCFEDGGGMAGKASDWWLKKHKSKGKDKADKLKSANAVETKENDKTMLFSLSSPLIPLTMPLAIMLHLPSPLVTATKPTLHSPLPALSSIVALAVISRRLTKSS
ncbi:hypothetical protein C0995_015334 [Termitomyces sp. Mi166|nr:hypothetical protein C0995_015334 [Termitomyces sp. Mi166\